MPPDISWCGVFTYVLPSFDPKIGLTGQKKAHYEIQIQ